MIELLNGCIRVKKNIDIYRSSFPKEVTQNQSKIWTLIEGLLCLYSKREKNQKEVDDICFSLPNGYDTGECTKFLVFPFQLLELSAICRYLYIFFFLFLFLLLRKLL